MGHAPGYMPKPAYTAPVEPAECDYWQVFGEGLPACLSCFCVFVPDIEDDVQRYSAVHMGDHDCECHRIG